MCVVASFVLLSVNYTNLSTFQVRGLAFVTILLSKEKFILGWNANFEHFPKGLNNSRNPKMTRTKLLFCCIIIDWFLFDRIFYFYFFSEGKLQRIDWLKGWYKKLQRITTKKRKMCKFWNVHLRSNTIFWSVLERCFKATAVLQKWPNPPFFYGDLGGGVSL